MPSIFDEVIVENTRNITDLGSKAVKRRRWSRPLPGAAYWTCAGPSLFIFTGYRIIYTASGL